MRTPAPIDIGPPTGGRSSSVALHEDLGFAPVGVYRRIGWKDGSWRDVGWWQLELQPPGDGKPAEPLPPKT